MSVPVSISAPEALVHNLNIGMFVCTRSVAITPILMGGNGDEMTLA